MRQTVNKSVEVTVPVCFGALAGVAGLAPLAVALSLVLAVGAGVIARDARRRSPAAAVKTSSSDAPPGARR